MPIKKQTEFIINNILLFQKGFLSQWYGAFKNQESSFGMVGTTSGNYLHFNCAEQYMMYAKSNLFGDKESAQKILNEKHPKEQQRLGRNVKNFKQDIWDKHKFRIVSKANYLKFTMNIDLKKKLLDTEPYILAEAASYDPVWGIGLSVKDPRAGNINTWRGLNLLGEALMAVRTNIKLEDMTLDSTM